MIRSSFHAWTASALAPAAAVGGSLRSSSSVGGRHPLDRVAAGGESEASVTSSGSRTASPRRRWPDGRGGASSRRRRGADTDRRPQRGERGRGRRRRLDGRTGCGRRGSPPQTPVWPGASPGASYGFRPRRPASAAITPTPAAAAFGSHGLGVRGPRRSRRRVVAVAGASCRPTRGPVAGAAAARSGRSKAMSSPAMAIPTRTRTRPARSAAGSSRFARNRPIRPPRELAREVDQLHQAEEPDVGHADARAASGPRRARAPCPGPTRGTSRDSSRTNGSSQRPVPNHGSDEVPPPVGQRALARQHERDQRHRAEDQQHDPDERPDDRRRDAQREAGRRARRASCARDAWDRRAVVEREAVVRRRVAIR